MRRSEKSNALQSSETSTSTGRTKKQYPIYVANATKAAADAYEHDEHVS